MYTWARQSQAHVVVCVFSIVVLPLIALRTAAQSPTELPIGKAGLYRILMPSVDQNEIERLQEDLQLDEDQARIVMSMYAGYMEGFMGAHEANQERFDRILEDVGPDLDWTVFGDRMWEASQLWIKERRQVEAGFVTDVQRVLTEEQLGYWPRYERDLRRRQTLDTAPFVAGEGVDLVTLVDDLELDAEIMEPLAPWLDQYADELDHALVARNQAEDSDFEDMFKWIFTGFDDSIVETDLQNDLEGRARKSHALHVAVRDTNDRFVNILAEHLDATVGSRLKEDYRRRSCPQFYGQTIADVYISSVRRLDTLSEEQIAGIDRIGVDHAERVADVNRRLVGADRLQEQARLDLRVAFLRRAPKVVKTMRETGVGPDSLSLGEPGDIELAADDPVLKIQEEKRGLVKSTMNGIWRSLTPEQQAAAPVPQYARDLIE